MNEDRPGGSPKRSACQACKIHVVGTSGSGKTTFAASLAGRLGIPYVEMDALFWGPGWSKTPDDVFRQKVESATQGAAWVIDGNYSRVRDLVWRRADVVIWLDYRLAVTVFRVVRRTVRRSLTHEELWHGNRERFRTSFLSRESIVLWTLRTYWRRKRDYTELAQRSEDFQLHVVRLRSTCQARQLLRNPHGLLGLGAA